MSLGHGQEIPAKRNLIWAIDVNNDKSWASGQSDVDDMTGTTTITANGALGAISSVTGNGFSRRWWNLRGAGGGAQVYQFSPAVNHELWSFAVWTRRESTPTVDYKGIIDLYETSLNTYFYRIDVRQTTNSYPLGYQKDDTISSWLSHNWGVAAGDWSGGDDYLLVTTHENGVFKSYRNGQLISTQTQTLSVDGYGDIDEVRINHNGSCTAWVGAAWMWDTVLTDGDVAQLFYSTRKQARSTTPYQFGHL